MTRLVNFERRAVGLVSDPKVRKGIGALCLGLLFGCSEPKDSAPETGDDDGSGESDGSAQYPKPCRDLYEDFEYEPGCIEGRGCLPSGVTVDDEDSLAVTLTCVPDPDGQLCPATCAGADPCLNNGVSVAYESGPARPPARRPDERAGRL